MIRPDKADFFASLSRFDCGKKISMILRRRGADLCDNPGLLFTALERSPEQR
jgi:hypothetical protein